MKGYDIKFLEEVKSKNDIVEVVSGYVPLTRRGNNFWGRCPFHHEKTPSFCVNSADQFYYCFGCHKSGDVFGFIREMESVEFSEAVRILAERAKIPLPEFTVSDEKLKEQKRKKETYLAILKETARYYAYNLRSGNCPDHIEYVKKRKLSTETLNKFGIGASSDHDGLIDHLKSKGFSPEDMFECGVAGRTGDKKFRYYDALAGRLIIPVIDGFNNVIAFCGRIITDRKDVGKYVNTRETPVFSKGKTLFNLNNLKKHKNSGATLKDVIVVEGHMDVITLVQAGFENVVASMGTALTKDQARIIKRFAGKSLICYDGDSAGQKAAIRGLEILRDEGLEVKVVSLPNGMDPDDVIKNYGAEGYQKLLDGAMPLSDFKIDTLKKTYDPSLPDEKRKFVAEALRIVKSAETASEQEDLLKTVRDYSGITIEALKRDLTRAEPDTEIPDVAEREKIVAGDKIITAERFVLFAKLFAKPYAADEDVSSIHFSVPAHAAIANYVSEKERKGEKPQFTDLYVELEDCGKALDGIAGLEADDSAVYDREAFFLDSVKTLKLVELNKRESILTSGLNEETDLIARMKMMEELKTVLAEKRSLK